MAGYETTAGALCWLLQHQLSHGAVRSRVESELEAVVGIRALAPEHLSQLVYLDAVIEESLRLQPLMPVGVRLTKRPVTVAGVELPAGVMCSQNLKRSTRSTIPPRCQ